MHGVVGKPPGAAANAVATSKIMLLMLVAMTGVAPISLYMLVPALPVLATTFGGDISVAQMTVSLYMVGIACSQLIMGPLSDKFGRRPVLLAGLALMVAASIGCSLAQTLPQLIAARFLQALGGATGMVVSRAIIRDLYSRDRISSMISLVIGVMMIGADAERAGRRPAGDRVRLARDLLFHHRGFARRRRADRHRAARDAPRARRRAAASAAMSASWSATAPFIGYVLCQVLASQIIFTFAGGGPYIVVTQMGRTTAEYGAWFATTGFAYLVGNLFCVRFAPRHSLEKLIWFGLALQFGGALLNLVLGITGTNQAPAWLFGTQMIVMVANAFVMNNAAAGAISVRPEAAGTASGAMGFLQQGIGALVSQFGAYLGGHSTTTLPLTAAIFALSIACASAMFFLVPRGTVVVSEELIKKAEEEESGMFR